MSALQKARAGQGKLTPVALRVLEKNHMDRVPVEVPKASRKDIGPPPEEMTSKEKAVWREVKSDVSWLSESSDRAAFKRLCVVIAAWEEAAQRVRDEGPYVVTKTGEVKESPAAIRERNAGDKLDRLLPKFGMTPADRQRIHVEPGTGVDPRDPLGLG